MLHSSCCPLSFLFAAQPVENIVHYLLHEDLDIGMHYLSSCMNLTHNAYNPNIRRQNIVVHYLSFVAAQLRISCMLCFVREMILVSGDWYALSSFFK